MRIALPHSFIRINFSSKSSLALPYPFLHINFSSKSRSFNAQASGVLGTEKKNCLSPIQRGEDLRISDG